MIIIRAQRTPAEAEQIRQMIMKHDSFMNVFRDDWTDKVMEELRYKLYGKIPRNFLVNIGGMIGSKTGIFKSTMGLQMALAIDPRFNLKERVGFSINDLLSKLEKFSEYRLCPKCFKTFQKTFDGTYEIAHEKTEADCNNCDNVGSISVLLTKMVFFLDEQTKTLKRGGMIRLQNIVDTVRQRQICFITCGVDSYDMNFSTYDFRRVQESHDDYLPEKRVRYGIYDTERDLYYGYFSWDITPLTDPDWKRFFDDYSVMKQDFQRIAISQKISAYAFEEFAEEVMEHEDFHKVWKEKRNGDLIIDKPLLKTLIFRIMPDHTNQNREMVQSTVMMMLKDQEQNGDDELQLTV